MTFIVVKSPTGSGWMVVATFTSPSETAPNLVYAQTDEYGRAENIANALNGA